MSIATLEAASLSQARAALDKIPTINLGGCGVAALALHRWALIHADQVSIPDRPFVFYWEREDYFELSRNDEKLAQGDLDAVEVPWHVGIELSGKVIDSRGLACGKTDIAQEYKLDEIELLHIINNCTGWNSAFNRRKYVPIIEKALQIDLSDVEI